MDFKSFLKQLAWGFLPLLFFSASEGYFSDHLGPRRGLAAALLVAVGLGVGQALYFFIREGKVDGFVLFDTGLIILLGGVSFVAQNDLFFKLKPAFIQIIMLAMLAAVAFFDPQLLFLWAGRYMPTMKVDAVQLKRAQRMAAGLFFLFLFHTILIVYAALYLSRGAWAFVSGGLFYLLGGLYIGGVWGWAFFKRRKVGRGPQGWVTLYDDQGRARGEMPPLKEKRIR